MSGLLGLIVVLLVVRWIVEIVRRPAPALQPTYEAEVARLREEVDTLTAQVARLTDEQQFLMKLLAPQDPSPPALPPQPPEPEEP